MLTYAGDVVILANNKSGMKETIKKFGGFMRKKGLELNIDKTKIIRLKKKGRTSKKTKRFKWEEKEIEEVKEFTYLGYVMKENNEEGEHIKKITKKANMALGKI